MKYIDDTLVHKFVSLPAKTEPILIEFGEYIYQ